MDFFPPKTFGDWIACLAAAMAVAVYGMQLVDRFRGDKPQPQNETLESARKELERRVAELEQQNVKVWCKMEADRIEAINRSNDLAVKLGSDLAGVNAKLDMTSQAASLLRLKLDQLK